MFYKASHYPIYSTITIPPCSYKKLHHVLKIKNKLPQVPIKKKKKNLQFLESHCTRKACVMRLVYIYWHVKFWTLKTYVIQHHFYSIFTSNLIHENIFKIQNQILKIINFSKKYLQKTFLNKTLWGSPSKKKKKKKKYYGGIWLAVMLHYTVLLRYCNLNIRIQHYII